MAIRVLLIEWFVIALVITAIAFGVGHLLRLTPSEIWYTIILAPRNLLILPITLLFAARAWVAARYEGYGLQPGDGRNANGDASGD